MNVAASRVAAEKLTERKEKFSGIYEIHVVIYLGMYRSMVGT